jgi:hypothetical protein
MSSVEYRLRILDELAADAERAWPGDLDRLTQDEYVQCLLMCALDRIHRNEVRGFARSRPAQPAALDITKLQIGLE